MAKYKYTRNLPLATGFQVEAKRPIDSKEIVLTFNDLLTVPGAYPGMEVKVEDEAFTKYIWTGINQSDSSQWIKVPILNAGHFVKYTEVNQIITPTNKVATLADISASGGGNVSGPLTSIDTNLATFSGTTGKIIQDSGKKLSDLATTAALANKVDNSRVLTDVPAGALFTDTQLLLQAGTNITIDATNPMSPIISATIGGAGDVNGPASAVADSIAVFDGITGKLIKDGGNKIADLAKLTDLSGYLKYTDANQAVTPTNKVATMADIGAGGGGTVTNVGVTAPLTVTNPTTTPHLAISPATLAQWNAGEANVNADWNATSGDAEILHKPTIPAPYTLPTASATIKGGIKIGSGLTMTGEVLSASGGGATVDPATQAEVDQGTVANKYVSPLTLENSAFRQNFNALEQRVHGISYTPGVPASPDTNLKTDHIGIATPMRMEGNQVLPTSSADRPKELATFSTVGTMIGQATSIIPFTQLSDTPGVYTGAAGKVVAVKSDLSGLEFIDPPTPGGGAMDVVLKSTNYTTALAEDGDFIKMVGGTSVILAKAGLPIGFNQILFNDTPNDIIITSSDGIDGVNEALKPGYHATYVLTEANKWTISTPYLDTKVRVQQIIGGSNVIVNNTNPTHPIVSANVGTTAGLTSKVYFTGEVDTVGGNPYYKTKVGDKGSVAAVNQTISVNDNQKKWFGQDAIGTSDPLPWTAPGGAYEAQLTVKASSNGGEQRFTIEIYRTTNSGTIIDSGISGVALGDLGVRPVMVLDSGIIDMQAGNETNVTLSGDLAQDFAVPAHSRFRYHVSGAKIGTSGGSETLTLYYGSNYHSFLNAPVEITTDGVINKSNVTGTHLTQVLNALDTATQDKGVETVVAGTNVQVDNSDPKHPIVKSEHSIQSNIAGTTGATAILNMVHMTQAAYTALATKVPTTIYVLKG